MRRGRKDDSRGIDLPDDQNIVEVEEEGYRYPGKSQLDQTGLNTKMKGNITAEYVKRIKKLCRSKLNGGSLFSRTNAWAVGVVRYSAGIVDWADILSVDAGSLPRRNIGSATTRWLYRFTGNFAERMC